MAGNAKIIDCFSTAQCYSYAASYVGVVAVTRAWTGGLAGRILTDKSNELVRSHFAGDLSSRQYNPIAVIPIIQNDVNLGGIAARANKGDATVTECYFKPSVSLNGSSQGNPAKRKSPRLAATASSRAMAMVRGMTNATPRASCGKSTTTTSVPAPCARPLTTRPWVPRTPMSGRWITS